MFQPEIDQSYDDNIAQHKTIIVNGAGNGQGGHYEPEAIATAYNTIGVNAFDINYTGPSLHSCAGPAYDGRSKPDITAPALSTSFSGPLVAGAAALLVQAAGTSSDAGDVRTVKALLLNGAIKPLYTPDPNNIWSHKASAPLDKRYGAGVLNVFNSYKQFAGGRHAFTISSTSSTVIPSTGGNVSVRSGWDFQSAITSSGSDRVNHYFFDLTGAVDGPFTLTSTLVWNRKNGQSAINNLDLYLYTADGTLIASSNSTIDNVEHLFAQALPPGRYDLQVFKHANDPVSDDETYALAFDFAPRQLIGAVSRKMHGPAGSFDVPLSFTGAPGIECRSGGTDNKHQVVFSFAESVTSFNKAEVTVGTGSVESTSGVGTNSITVNLTGVEDAQTIIVALLGVNDGTRMSDVGVKMGVLLGDVGADVGGGVGADGVVNSADVLQTKDNAGQSTDGSNFRTDVDADGDVDSDDLAIVRDSSGHFIP